MIEPQPSLGAKIKWAYLFPQEFEMAEQTKMPALTGNTLGARITEARSNRGWGREDFRERLRHHSEALNRLGYSTVFNWEVDKKIPKMPALIAIAQLTGYSVEEIAEGTKVADEFAGTLSAERIDQLLAALGASEATMVEVHAELAAYPRKGGVTREDIVMIHRLLTARRAEANGSAAAKLDALGGRRAASKDRPRARKPAKDA
jgi:hypothetical protein